MRRSRRPQDQSIQIPFLSIVEKLKKFHFNNNENKAIKLVNRLRFYGFAPIVQKIVLYAPEPLELQIRLREENDGRPVFGDKIHNPKTGKGLNVFCLCDVKDGVNIDHEILLKGLEKYPQYLYEIFEYKSVPQIVFINIVGDYPSIEDQLCCQIAFQSVLGSWKLTEDRFPGFPYVRVSQNIENLLFHNLFGDGYDTEICQDRFRVGHQDFLHTGNIQFSTYNSARQRFSTFCLHREGMLGFFLPAHVYDTDSDGEVPINSLWSAINSQ